MSVGEGFNGDGWEGCIDAEWPRVAPIPEAPSVPRLPLEQLPDCLRGWIADAAERMQMPAEMIAVPAIVSAGALIGRSLAVQPKRRDTTWVEYSNLWGLMIAPPSSMKSVGLGEGVSHVSAIADRDREEHEAGRLEREAKLQALDIEVELEKKAARKSGDTETLSRELAGLEQRRAEIDKPARRLITQDPTIEKLGELLRDNPRGILLNRDELSGWLETFVKSGREGSRPFYLEAWSGKAAHSVDRIGRGAVHVPAACVSVLGTIQPAKLSAIATQTVKNGGDGLLQRFSMSVWPDFPPEWRNIDREPDREAYARARRVYDAIDRLPQPDHAAGAEIPRLQFSEGAQCLFDGWITDHEHMLRSDGTKGSPGVEGHFGKYRKLMPALALLIHVVETVDQDGPLGPITEDSARRAAAWCEYLEQHARRIYGAYNIEAVAAKALSEKIQGGFVVDGQPVREIYQPGWSNLKSSDAAQAGCVGLERLGWLRVEDHKPERSGRPSPIVRLHPDIIDRQRYRHE